MGMYDSTHYVNDQTRHRVSAWWRWGSSAGPPPYVGMGRGVTRSFSGLRCQYDTDEERIDAIPARRVDDLSLLRGRAGGDCVEADEGVEGRVVDGGRAAGGGGVISRTPRA